MVDLLVRTCPVYSKGRPCPFLGKGSGLRDDCTHIIIGGLRTEAKKIYMTSFMNMFAHPHSKERLFNAELSHPISMGPVVHFGNKYFFVICLNVSWGCISFLKPEVEKGLNKGL